MKQAKKIFTRMCLNNWGGIRHKILEFNEYVNLFSGKSGSGKSTVMDAVQVILYGSFSPSFLNRAADDAKNRRSVLSYLRGEQKDGSANREGQDFCSEIVLELLDTGNGQKLCMGIAFEVRKSDTEIRKFVYFTHQGPMPEDGYLGAGGYPYSNADIRSLVEERLRAGDGRGRGELNRIYPSREAYLGALYDAALGCIDGSRFMTMEKSAIALKMTNGTGQFIRDYMFPRSQSDTIGTISEQLGAYRDIKEKIDVLEQKIGMLKEVKAAGDELTLVRADLVRGQSVLSCIDIEDLRNRIDALKEDKLRCAGELERLRAEKGGLEELGEQAENELIRVSADLKSSDLGSRQEHLEELSKRSRMLADNAAQWRKILQGLSRWESDEIITDYVSNRMLQLLEAFGKGPVTREQCSALAERIREARENIEEEYETCREEQKALTKELKEKRRLLDDMKNNRKSYPEGLTKARAALEQRLCALYGRTVKVQVLADLFDVEEEEWKNAVEGRLGRRKLSLITEPGAAQDAARIFRELGQFEEAELIDSAAVADSAPAVLENSLYGAVRATEPYVDACLKRYLGRVIKCRTVEELRAVPDGVTPDCYSHSNFVFRHLRRRDYTAGACIGGRVSKARRREYEEDVRQLEERLQEATRLAEGLKKAREMESLQEEPSYLEGISAAEAQLEQVLAEKNALEQEIAGLREGKFKELREREKRLRSRRDELRSRLSGLQEEITRQVGNEERIGGELAAKSQSLEELFTGYTGVPEDTEWVREALRKRSGMAVKAQKNAELQALSQKREELEERLAQARNAYIIRFPASGFSGTEKSNEGYERLLEQYQGDFEPRYREEFEKQCDLIYRSLRENVIATIHGDIKAARRHASEINRLLLKTNFSDSTYQIKIEPARNENGQFYDMLMAAELDSKNLDNDGYEGQISLGEDSFYQKYEHKIRLLTDKFMPPRGSDERELSQRRREMEQYADYRNYLSFSMYEQVTDAEGNVIRENYVDDMAGRDSGGEGQNPKYVALLAGFAMLYMQQTALDSKIRLVLLDEAFSKMDQERSAVCLRYARQMDLQLIVCVPDERLQSLIRNVDCVYGFRRHNNQITMMHIDKGAYLELLEGERESKA
ncbi:MAG: SbcC/MukB-like Walker B domain-containing protein [Eubacteriales bacterium]|nr:SbcC/MukB-like Walker B domain-containing protein [Eubacteriales bacterium]